MIGELLKAMIAKQGKQDLRSNKPSTKAGGFTLLELLAVVVTSSIVISTLLFLVNNLTETNRREIARSVTQEEMKRALDYIARELREAVFVYSGNELTAIQGDFSMDQSWGRMVTRVNRANPLTPSNRANRPILAFWKVEPVDEGDIPDGTTCSSITDVTQQRECSELRGERRQYTFVMYIHSNDNPGEIWQGESRIKRYELQRYETPTSTNPVGINPNYNEPDRSDFPAWRYAGPDILGNIPVLVDYVAVPTDEDENLCNIEYSRTPLDQNIIPPSADDLASFYACVSQNRANTNQNVQLYLKGNSGGRFGFNSDDNPDEFKFLLQTGVIVRGFINRN